MQRARGHQLREPLGGRGEQILPRKALCCAQRLDLGVELGQAKQPHGLGKGAGVRRREHRRLVDQCDDGSGAGHSALKSPQLHRDRRAASNPRLSTSLKSDPRGANAMRISRPSFA